MRTRYEVSSRTGRYNNSRVNTPLFPSYKFVTLYNKTPEISVGRKIEHASLARSK